MQDNAQRRSRASLGNPPSFAGLVLRLDKTAVCHKLFDLDVESATRGSLRMAFWLR
jgi:hypothetical protein